MTDRVNQRNKEVVWDYWRALDASAPDSAEPVCRKFLSHETVWRGFDPLGDLAGPGEFTSIFLSPFKASFPDLKRHLWLFFGGRSNGRVDGSNDGRMWVTGTGVFRGTFARDYLSIPATGGEVELRWGEFCRLDKGAIVETFFLIDLIDLMRQAGFYVLPPSRGRDACYPPPAAGDGILRGSVDRAESAHGLQHIRRFIFDGLNRFDETNLESMGMADFFHPQVKWFGPGGIGACFSLAEFETLHQTPWLRAFPDRRVQDLDALIAEGPYSGAPGWDGVVATHQGEYLGQPATGNRVGVNGLDWWTREGEHYVENWVFVDMIHLFRQLDLDLLERLEEQKASV